MRLPINLDMDVLRTFVLGTQLGGFAKAARSVGRSQPAISLQMRKLEQQTGETLFRKQGRNLLLTESGNTLLRYAQKILELNDEALSTIGKGSRLSGRIGLGMPPDLAESWLPTLLGHFIRMHPDIVVEARVDRNSELLHAMTTGALDIALLWSSNGEQIPGEVIDEFPIVWIGPHGFEVNRRSEIPMVVMESPCMFRSLGLEALRAADRRWRIAFTSSSLAGLWAAASAGLGVTVRTTAAPLRDVEVLESRNLPNLGRARLHLVTTTQPSAPIQELVAALKETIHLTTNSAIKSRRRLVNPKPKKASRHR